MNTSITQAPVLNSLIERGSSIPSSETRQLVALGKRHRWPFQVLGQAPMLEEPVRLGDWLLIPAQQDSSPIPERALARIQAIFSAGLRPQGFVLVHEAPKILKAPIEEKIKPPNPSPSPATTTVSASDFATALGTGLATLASIIFPMLFMVVAAAVADPILVAVTEDGWWIEIDRWYTE